MTWTWCGWMHILYASGAQVPKHNYLCEQVRGDRGKEQTPFPFPLQLYGLIAHCLRPSLTDSLADTLRDRAKWESFISTRSKKGEYDTHRNRSVSRSLSYKRASWDFVLKMATPLWDLTVTELRRRLSERKLSTIGRKSELVSQLIQSLESNHRNPITKPT